MINVLHPFALCRYYYIGKSGWMVSIFLIWPFWFCFSTADVIEIFHWQYCQHVQSSSDGAWSVQCAGSGHIVSCVTVTPDTCPGPGVSGQCPHVVTHSANITRNIYSILSTQYSCSVWSQDSRHGNCFPSSSDFNSKMVSIYQFDWHLKSDEGRGIQTVIQSGPQASKFSPGVSTLSFLQPSMSILEEQ